MALHEGDRAAEEEVTREPGGDERRGFLEEMGIDALLYRHSINLIAGIYAIALAVFVFRAAKNRRGWVVLEIFGMAILNVFLSIAIADTVLIGALAHCGHYSDALFMAAVMAVFTILTAIGAQMLADHLDISGRIRWLVQFVNLPQYLCWSISVILWMTWNPGGAG